MSKPVLPYTLARDLDDFLSGQAVAEAEFWVRITGEPRIDEKKRTVLPVETAVEGAQGTLESLGHDDMKIYPSTLADVEQEIRRGFDVNMWLLVHVEKPYSDRPRTRRYKIYDRRSRTLSQNPPQSPGPVTAASSPPSEEHSPYVPSEQQQASQEAGGSDTPPPAAPPDHADDCTCTLCTMPSTAVEAPEETPIPSKQQPCGHPLLDRIRIDTEGTAPYPTWRCSICGKLYEEAE